MRVLITPFFASILVLTGCGQKGPLYIEQDKGLNKPSVTTAVANDTKRKDDKQSNE